MAINICSRKLARPVICVVLQCLSIVLCACAELNVSPEQAAVLKREADQLALDVKAADDKAGVVDSDAQSATHAASSAAIAAQAAQMTASLALSSDAATLTGIEGFNEKIDRVFKKSAAPGEPGATSPPEPGATSPPEPGATSPPNPGATRPVKASPAPQPAPSEKPRAQIPVSADSPWYGYRLTSSAIRRYHQEVLSVAVSPTQNTDILLKTLLDHQKGLESATSSDANEGATAQSDVKSNGGTLEAAQWKLYQYIIATIDCDPILECKTDKAPKSVTNDPLIWDVTLNSAQYDATRTTVISVRFFGGHSLSDAFNEEIATMPPLAISVKVYQDIGTTTKWFQQLEELFKALRGALVALVTVITLVLGWFGWKRKSHGKAKGPPGPPP
jgi:hypothetical protein